MFLDSVSEKSRLAWRIKIKDISNLESFHATYSQLTNTRSIPVSAISFWEVMQAHHVADHAKSATNLRFRPRRRAHDDVLETG